jgi:hypothetical protein
METYVILVSFRLHVAASSEGEAYEVAAETFKECPDWEYMKLLYVEPTTQEHDE